MKPLIIVLFLLLSACAGKEKNYTTATDALDAGREYLQACMQGDFEKAAFYMVPDEPNRATLNGIEKKYREKDKEGRQQLRNASLRINAINNRADGSVEINYNDSFDAQAKTLVVVNNNGAWLVNPAKP